MVHGLEDGPCTYPRVPFNRRPNLDSGFGGFRVRSPDLTGHDSLPLRLRPPEGVYVTSRGPSQDPTGHSSTGLHLVEVGFRPSPRGGPKMISVWVQRKEKTVGGNFTNLCVSKFMFKFTFIKVDTLILLSQDAPRIDIGGVPSRGKKRK